ncbi:MAG: hypothetical protein M1538_01595 [Candidatus Marsarchaeota archaeon]|jgi:tRNA (guanine37-N1)-methyltransferase|nr:hypothetical protein [Candidatus Marsarchaeota archaeon]
MKYIKIKSKYAERIKKILLKHNIFNKNANAFHKEEYVYFPILNVDKQYIKKIINIPFSTVSKQNSNSIIKKLTLRNIFKNDKDVIKSYDLLGNIAIINIRKNITTKMYLKSKAILAAKVLMKIHPNIKTVISKAGAISGIYRIRNFYYVAGKKNYIAEYRENNCIFKFDVRKSFFSSRLSYERTRLIKLVKDNSNVVVMFAGVGPFSIEIAKAHPSSKIVSIELNKNAYLAMCDNIKLNKVKNVKPVFGNVKKIAKNCKNFADFIVMPLPKSSMNFLDEAYIVAKNKAIVSIYVFGQKEHIYNDTIKEIQKHAEKNKYKTNILFNRIVRPYSKDEDEIVIDYEIIKQ